MQSLGFFASPSGRRWPNRPDEGADPLKEKVGKSSCRAFRYFPRCSRFQSRLNWLVYSIVRIQLGNQVIRGFGRSDSSSPGFLHGLNGLFIWHQGSKGSARSLAIRVSSIRNASETVSPIASRTAAASSLICPSIRARTTVLDGMSYSFLSYNVAQFDQETSLPLFLITKM